jgi:hypothetical protein
MEKGGVSMEERDQSEVGTGKLTLTWQRVRDFRRELRSVERMLDDMALSFGEPQAVVIEQDDSEIRVQGGSTTVLSRYPCRLTNRTTEDIAVWFYDDAERTESRQREILDGRGRPRQQPIVIESGESVPFRLDAVGETEGVWIAVSYVRPTGFQASEMHRNGPEIKINNP